MTSRRPASDAATRLTRHAWREAAWNGRLDALRGVPRLPAGKQADGKYSPARPPFRDVLQHRVNRAAHLRQAHLFGTGGRLAAEISVAARVVVTHEAEGNRTDADQIRFCRALHQWNAQASAQGKWAEAAVDDANVQLNVYRAKILRWHTGLRSRGRADLPDWEPDPVTLDPAWPNPLELLRVWKGEGEYGVISRALEIVDGTAS